MGSGVSLPLLLARVLDGSRTVPAGPKDSPYLVKFSSVPYSGAFPTVPFEYAYNGRMEDERGNPVSLSGALVIVGDYADTTGDLHAVPTGVGSRLMSGMEVVAQKVRDLAEGTSVHELSARTTFLTALLSFVVIALAFASVPSLPIASLLAVLWSVLAFSVSYAGFDRGGVWISPMPFRETLRCGDLET